MQARVGGGKSWKSIELEEYRGGKSWRQELEQLEAIAEDGLKARND